MKRKSGKPETQPVRLQDGQRLADSVVEYDKPNEALDTDVADTNSVALTWNEPFRFLDLPAEMRVSVYNQLLPNDMVIGFEMIEERWHYSYTTGKSGRRMEELGSSGYANTRWMVLGWDERRYKGAGKRLDIRPGISLFLVNKFISNEARAVLYGSNSYDLEIDGLPHQPVSLQSPLIFGPLGLEHRLPLLRNLRSITLNVVIDSDSRWVAIRHRARLGHFVDIIKQHADDANQKSLLKHLTVHFKCKLYPPIRPGKFMFALESLASLRGIDEVKVTGVAPWFQQCLELCIKGKGRDLKELDWPLVEVMRKKATSQTKIKVWISTRKWHHPTLNWTAFAERIRIAVPANIEGDDVDVDWTPPSEHPSRFVWESDSDL